MTRRRQCPPAGDHAAFAGGSALPSQLRGFCWNSPIPCQGLAGIRLFEEGAQVA